MILKVRKTKNLTKISPQGMINLFLWLRMSCFKMPCVSNGGKYKNKVFYMGIRCSQTIFTESAVVEHVRQNILMVIVLR